MSGFNLSDWALRHKSFVLYLMPATTWAGRIPPGSLSRSARWLLILEKGM